MIKPNFVGPKSLYLNPAGEFLTTAELALIDTPMADPQILSPYAYTATVRDNYDAHLFNTSAAGSAVAAASRVAFGLFLSPELSKHNFLFQVCGRVRLAMTTAACTGAFFFGRKATDNTVVSSKAAASNQLALYTLLPSMSVSHVSAFLDDSIETEIFSLELAAGFVYCFGYMLENYNAALAPVLQGGISLAIRKYTDPLDVYRVTG